VSELCGRAGPASQAGIAYGAHEGADRSRISGNADPHKCLRRMKTRHRGDISRGGRATDAYRIVLIAHQESALSNRPSGVSTRHATNNGF